MPRRGTTPHDRSRPRRAVAPPTARAVEEVRVQETQGAGRIERAASETDDDPGGSADHDAAPGRGDHALEEQNPDDFEEQAELGGEVSHG